MASNPYFVNQQYMQGCAAGQQAAMAEMAENIPVAAQMYDQAVALIGGAMMMAAQTGLQVNDQNFFVLSCCNFNAARAKAAMGFGPAAMMHLAQALDAINRAVSMNPAMPQYYAAAGTILAAQGNFPAADQLFQRAVQMNPADGWSRWMLGTLHSLQGNTAAANQYYAAAQQVAPQLPTLQQAMPQWTGATPGGPPASEHKDWFGMIFGCVKLANNLFDTFGGSQEQPQQGQAFGGWQ